MEGTSTHWSKQNSRTALYQQTSFTFFFFLFPTFFFLYRLLADYISTSCITISSILIVKWVRNSTQSQQNWYFIILDFLFDRGRPPAFWYEIFEGTWIYVITQMWCKNVILLLCSWCVIPTSTLFFTIMVCQ